MDSLSDVATIIVIAILIVGTAIAFINHKEMYYIIGVVVLVGFFYILGRWLDLDE